MTKRSSTSLHWLTLAVVLPLILLAAVAWWGTRSQLNAAWTEARDQAERLAASHVAMLSRELPPLMQTAPIYPEPPVPGKISDRDAILDGRDVSSLIALRDDRKAGLSPAGLPRQALAALRISDISSAAQKPEDLGRILVREAPSLLTWHAAGKIDPESAIEWTRAEEARHLVREYPAQATNGFYWYYRGTIWWIRQTEGFIRYVLPQDLEKLGVGRLGGISSWAVTELEIEGIASQLRPGEVPVVSTPLPFAAGQNLVVAVNRELLEAPIRRQQRWSTALLALSVVTASLGLFFIHRTLRRERQLNDMKSQFVASVSHELRAPVASIRLMADALEAEKVAPETAKEFHRLIAREGARLSTLVGNVLDHARIEQGRRVWKMETCELESLVADTLRVMEPLAQEKNIALRSALSPVEASVDAGAIQQALVNLLDNAIKFSPPGSAVETSLSCDDGSRTWRLAVKDDGPGIAKAEQGRIFERFYRPGDELRRETQGTGIGLSLVRAIAEAHGGSVSIESELGRGSVFTLAGSAGLQTGAPGPPVFRPAVGDHADPWDDTGCREPSGRSQTGAPGEPLSRET